MSSKKRRGAAPSVRPSPPPITGPRGGDSSNVQGARRDWRWRTFPVFAAFTLGLLVAFLVNEGSANPVAFVSRELEAFLLGHATGRSGSADRKDAAAE